LLSVLAYYYEGLTRNQFREAIRKLLGLGGEAQHYYYSQVYNQVKNEIDDEARNKVDSVTKIDLTNMTQQDVLYDLFHKSTELINFWVNNCVFPIDTAQYEHNIAATAWHIVTCTSRGFSGTNDTHWLYPLQVQRSDVESLRGTNGRMLHMLIKHAHYTKLNVSSCSDLLDWVITNRLDAIIDTGAQLADLSNEDVAMYIIKHPKFDTNKFKGVCYYEPNFTDGANWLVLDAETFQKTQRNRSSINDWEAFVIFDDPRTRGADFKLGMNTVAALTLNVGITKDKVIQGAGRLRQLGMHQTLVIIGNSETDSSIRFLLELDVTKSIDVCNILQWIVLNTKTANSSGMSQWAMKGLRFCSENVNEDENWDLAYLYTEAEKHTTLRSSVYSKFSSVNSSKMTSSKFSNIRDEILGTIDKFGEDIMVMVNDRGEECERELQMEEQQQYEAEKQDAEQTPIVEKCWNYSAVTTATTMQELGLCCLGLADGISKAALPTNQIKNVSWYKCANVFGTLNFSKRSPRLMTVRLTSFVWLMHYLCSKTITVY
jgi:hypothetical protein